MKTLIFKSQDNKIRAEIKVDLFATLEQLQQPGFDSRFTGMEIKDDWATIAYGVDITEIEHNWQSLIYLAQTTGLGLYVIDLNGKGVQEVEIVCPSQDHCYSGGGGALGDEFI